MTAEPVDPPVRLTYRLEYAPFVAARALCEGLGLRRATGTMAALARRIGPLTPLRRRALRNLDLAMPGLPDAERRRILDGVFDNFCRTAIEYLFLPRLIAEEDRIEIVDGERYRAASGNGGAVLVSGHLGNWEAVRIACDRLSRPPALIYRGFNNPLVDRDARRLMRCLDAPVLHKGRSGTLALLRHLRNGGTVMILSDQRFRGAPELPFFGIPATTALAAAELAQRNAVPLIPVRALRKGRTSRFSVLFDDPIPVGNGPDGPKLAMSAFNARLEHWIRAEPGQYFWFHNRWGKRVPAPRRDRQ